MKLSRREFCQSVICAPAMALLLDAQGQSGRGMARARRADSLAKAGGAGTGPFPSAATARFGGGRLDRSCLGGDVPIKSASGGPVRAKCGWADGNRRALRWG